MENVSNLPEKIKRLYTTINKTVISWRYANTQRDRIEVDLGLGPRVLDVWSHNGMSWHLEKPQE